MWSQISRKDFEDLYASQRENISPEGVIALEKYAIPTTTAIIRRSDEAGDERVFVVAKTPKGVLYYDDVENGFNFSRINRENKIIEPGGSQMDLSDAVQTWLVPLLE